MTAPVAAQPKFIIGEIREFRLQKGHVSVKLGTKRSHFSKGKIATAPTVPRNDKKTLGAGVTECPNW